MRIDHYPLTRPRLLAVWRGASTSAMLPSGGQLVVGRGLSADLRVDVASVSREHALIVDGSPPCIIDAESANGVRVDGLSVVPGQAIALESGKLVELGDGAFLLLDYLAPAATAAASGADAPTSHAERATRTPGLESTADRVRRLESASARLLRLSDTIATTTLSVLIDGEPGVGKAALAKRLHRRSARARGAFLHVDCAAFDLAGVEATRHLLEQSEGGSLLLEHVDQLPSESQAILSRLLGPPNALGLVDHTGRPDLRLLATCERDLAELVIQGLFAGELYLRLNGVRLTPAPLRARRAEIGPLAHQFLVEAADQVRLKAPGIGPDARRWLEEHDWPGNLLELRRVVENALMLSGGGPIELDHLQRVSDFGARSAPPTGVQLRTSLPEPERSTNPFASSEPLP